MTEHLSRRAILGATAALTIATAAQAGESLTTPAARLRATMLLRGALDERLVVSFIECNYWGVVNAQMTPFYNLSAATFARYKARPDGGYDVVSFEVEFFIDPATGGILSNWQNPYTGKMVVAKHNDSVPIKYSIGADCQLATLPKPLFPGTVIKHETLPLRVVGDDVWSTDTTFARVPPSAPGGKPIFFNEKIINHGHLSAITRPGVKQIHADVTYVGVSSFRPWQEMAENQPGEMLGLGHGAVGLDRNDLPATWKAAAAIHRPQALTDPGAFLDPLWHTL
jgi:hypothetical protein